MNRQFKYFSPLIQDQARVSVWDVITFDANKPLHSHRAGSCLSQRNVEFLSESAIVSPDKRANAFNTHEFGENNPTTAHFKA